ncbi:long-chain-acyl-CoA dehydrogenase [Parafrankia irregularis]|uniref:Acyl-[acyl-carrier-protein] dehydrogenase MbtN n=1 Tax=Parafrankia irregularis TaxID=795642 RepID=A0A0S4QM31_9ACTN|nr:MULTISPECIES: acyl-CoA dehydrogenase family protein [Parafrankia]MBE3201256.1 acyl-CoA dehydrogenase family protein [Parafrankia sp. CH37]CUU56297.1 long-chain-acyl-CoA dehydrogenase [Parafrankia irregularis]
MRRTVYGPEHDAFRAAVRSFFEKEIGAHYNEWEEAGLPPRDFYNKAGDLGILGLCIPEEYGGGGADFLFNAVVTEEAARAGYALGPLRIHADISVPYFVDHGNAEQKQRWLPGLASGELVAALALTEPGAGSDLAGMSTSARRDGDHYVVNGSKTFITGGLNADLFLTAVKTDPTQRHAGLSLLVIPGDLPGVSRGAPLHKIGLHIQEAVEIFFDDVRVPAENLLGEEGQGFTYLTSHLVQERLSIAINAQGAAASIVEQTVEYVNGRKLFGKTLNTFQNTKFVLAGAATEVDAGQALLDQVLLAHVAGEATPADAAKVKLYCTEMQGRVIDACLQLFGGYGYINEYPVARAWADARVGRIYGGSSEVMKTIIAKSLGL